MTPAELHQRERLTAGERREEIIQAAMTEFALGGLAGTSTDAIARRVGISQPYLFRLFGTKRGLFIATIRRCMEDTRVMFEAAANGHQGEAALEAMGDAYIRAIINEPTKLRAQLQSYASCGDAVISDAVREGFGELVATVERLSGASTEKVAEYFAKGMLLNVLAAMGALTGTDPWAARLREGCIGDRHG